VLLDLGLPDVPGVEICRRMKSEPDTADIAVIHMSAQVVDAGTKVDGFDGGADAYISHPVAPEELVAVVRAVLRTREAERKARRNAEELRQTQAKLGWVLSLLQDKNAALQALVHASPLGIITLNEEGIVNTWNPAAEAMFGWTADEVLGRPAPIIDEKNGESAAGLYEGAGANVIGHETWRRRKDGSMVEVSVSVAPLRDVNDRRRGFMVLVEDISAKKRTQERLLMAETAAANSRLAGALAHEINNPLETLTNALFLLRTSVSGETGRKFLRMATEAVDRIAQLTRHMVGLHYETNVPGPVRIDAVLDEVLAMFTTQLREKRLAIDKRFGCAAEVQAFGGEMRHVFAYLIGNAVDSSRADGQIVISTAARRAWRDKRQEGVRVMIVDSGAGISHEKLKQIAEPFYNTSRDDRGIGLALWVARNVLQKHGGYLRVRSRTRKGHSGTAIMVFIPTGRISETTPNRDTRKTTRRREPGAQDPRAGVRQQPR
jgi:PAS domain S-box-containing protein